jgi:hypothetical protein
MRLWRAFIALRDAKLYAVQVIEALAEIRSLGVPFAVERRAYRYAARLRRTLIKEGPFRWQTAAAESGAKRIRRNAESSQRLIKLIAFWKNAPVRFWQRTNSAVDAIEHVTNGSCQEAAIYKERCVAALQALPRARTIKDLALSVELCEQRVVRLERFCMALLKAVEEHAEAEHWLTGLDPGSCAFDAESDRLYQMCLKLFDGLNSARASGGWSAYIGFARSLRLRKEQLTSLMTKLSTLTAEEIRSWRSVAMKCIEDAEWRSILNGLGDSPVVAEWLAKRTEMEASVQQRGRAARSDNAIATNHPTLQMAWNETALSAHDDFLRASLAWAPSRRRAD